MAILVFQHHPAEPPASLGRVLRDHGHRLDIIEPDAGQAMPVDLDNVDGIVSLGGPMNVADQAQYPWMSAELNLIRRAYEQDIPVVGICLGMQLLAHALGGSVEPMSEPEIGFGPIDLSFPGTTDPLLSGIPWHSPQFHLHSQQVTELPEGATPLASSRACKIQAFKVGLKHYGFQFHFEYQKRDFQTLLEAHAGWLTQNGQDLEALNGELEQHYALYRHLGDRLCANIANLLMPLDKRLGGRRGVDVSWTPN